MYSAPISGRQRMRPPLPRMRAASSESWSLCQSSCQPPCDSRTERGQTPVNPLSTSISPSEACRNCAPPRPRGVRSEEHTSELQSLRHLVCRLLLEKKKKGQKITLHRRQRSLEHEPTAVD